MKRLLWIALLSIAVPITLLLGLPPALEYWMVTIASLASTLLALWEYSLRRNGVETASQSPEPEDLAGNDVSQSA